MSKRAAVLIGAGLAVLVAGALAVGWVVFWSPQSNAAPTAGQSSAAPAPSPSATAKLRPVPSDVGEAIAKLPSDPSGGVAATSPFQSAAARAVPSGSTAAAVSDTWDSASDTTGTLAVDLTTSGSPTKRYTALMVKENGTWKVFATVEEEK